MGRGRKPRCRMKQRCLPFLHPSLTHHPRLVHTPQQLLRLAQVPEYCEC